MKRGLALLFVCTALAALFAGCAKPQTDDIGRTDDPPPTEMVTGTIVQCDSDALLLAAPEGGLYSIARDGAMTGLDDAALAPGSELSIGFSGAVMESYPMQIASVQSVQWTPGDDLVGLFLAVTEELWEVDTALNDNVEYLAFDLSKASNLTVGEKEAVAWLAASKHSATALSGTYEELNEQGFITDMYFEKGLLYEFTVTEKAADSFAFHVVKWRSGLAALLYNNCTAHLTGNTWGYELGDFAIA